MSEEKKDEILEQEKELSMEELDAVAGGDICVCVGVGAGEATKVWQNNCGCVAVGIGSDNNGNNRCGCFAGGGGSDD